MYNIKDSVQIPMEIPMRIIAVLLTLLAPVSAIADQFSDQIWHMIQTADEVTGDPITRNKIESLTAGQKRLMLMSFCEPKNGRRIVTISSQPGSISIHTVCK